MLLCIGLILGLCFCILKIFSIRDNFESGYIHCNSGDNYLINKVLNFLFGCLCTLLTQKTPHLKYGVEVYFLKILLLIGSA